MNKPIEWPAIIVSDVTLTERSHEPIILNLFASYYYTWAEKYLWTGLVHLK